MVELGHPDAVLQPGQEIIARGMQQIGQSDDEGETASEFAEFLPVVFKAAAESSLSRARKLLFAIDVLLQEDYSLMGSDGCRAAAQPAIRSLRLVSGGRRTVSPLEG